MAATQPTGITVVKLGGSILTGPPAYQHCAEWIRARLNADPTQRLVVVVSAQYGETDALLATAREITPEPAAATLDLLWSTGEIRSVALLTLWLQRAGVRAVGLNVHECGVVSPTGERDASTMQVKTLRLQYWLTRYPVIVVPGFLARAPFDSLVTLGRGGSDLTAVLLAAALKADSCELIKDVPGYFSDDPHCVASARPLPALTYAQALAMASAGCDLVQTAAVEAAQRSSTRLVVRSADEQAPRTVVSDRAASAAAEPVAARAGALAAG
jgi:aspartate kinase